MRDERARQVGVRDWSFWVHSLMAGEAPAPTRLHRQSHSSRPKSSQLQNFILTTLLILKPHLLLSPIFFFLYCFSGFQHNVSFMHVGGPLFSSLKLRLSGILMGLCPFSFFQKFNLWLKVNVHYSVICVVIIFLELYSLYGWKNDFRYFQNQLSQIPHVFLLNYYYYCKKICI